MSIKEGKELIIQIEKTRKEVNHENYHVENASWRIETIKSYNGDDRMWQRIKEEHEIKLKEATKKLEKLYQEFSSLKISVSREEWNYLLESLGNVLAKTEDIEHVANSLYDEHDLHRALTAVGETIKKKWEELEAAKEQGDEDSIVLINAQLRYHTNDICSHFWGEERLKYLIENYNKGKGRK